MASFALVACLSSLFWLWLLYLVCTRAHWAWVWLPNVDLNSALGLAGSSGGDVTSLGLGLGFVVSSSWSSPGVLFPWEPSLGLVAGSVGLSSGSLLAWRVWPHRPWWLPCPGLHQAWELERQACHRPHLRWSCRWKAHQLDLEGLLPDLFLGLASWPLPQP